MGQALAALASEPAAVLVSVVPAAAVVALELGPELGAEPEKCLTTTGSGKGVRVQATVESARLTAVARHRQVGWQRLLFDKLHERHRVARQMSRLARRSDRSRN